MTYKNQPRSGGTRKKRPSSRTLYPQRQAKRNSQHPPHNPGTGQQQQCRGAGTGQSQQSRGTQQQSSRGAQRNCRNNTASASTDDDFLNAFGNVDEELDDEQRRQMADHDREITEQVNQLDEIAARAERNRVGDAAGKDGSRLYIGWRMGAGRVQVNHGNVSSFEWHAYSQHLQSAMQQKKVPVSKMPGCCSIHGCSWTNLAPDHRCHNCRDAGIHNMCTQEKRLTGANELDMYCSEECKKAVEGE